MMGELASPPATKILSPLLLLLVLLLLLCKCCIFEWMNRPLLLLSGLCIEIQRYLIQFHVQPGICLNKIPLFSISVSCISSDVKSACRISSVPPPFPFYDFIRRADLARGPKAGVSEPGRPGPGMKVFTAIVILTRR